MIFAIFGSILYKYKDVLVYSYTIRLQNIFLSDFGEIIVGALCPLTYPRV